MKGPGTVLTFLFALCVATPAMAQSGSASFPDTPQGRMAAGFFAAANASGADALFSFQEANFSEAALKRRPAEERRRRNVELREQVGRMTLLAVRSASDKELVVSAGGSNLPAGMSLTVTFTFTSDPSLKIDTIQITGG